MRFENRIVTPEQAQEWLTTWNQGNRRINQTQVKTLAADIVAGRFLNSHQAIAFSEKRLIDGQHRLHAIVLAGVSVMLAVAWDVNPDTFLVVDQGRKKSSADVFGGHAVDMEAVRFASALVKGRNPTQFGVQEFIPVVLPLATKLREHSGTTTRVLSSASMRLGAIVRMLEGESESYILKLYGDLVNYNFEQLPTIAQALVAQVAKDHVRATDKINTLAKSMIVFTESNAPLRRLLLKNSGLYVERARQALLHGLRSNGQLDS
jgi:hypothetical protein